MSLMRRTCETQFLEPRRLDSRTPGVAFEMTGSAQWKPGRTSHRDIEAVICNVVVHRAQAIAAQRYGDDIRSAQDAINADLSICRRERSPHYSSLAATVTLRLSKQNMTSALEFRDSLARIERLRFLKQQLYSDPSMLLLDYLDRNPEKLDEPPDFARFQQLALRVSNGDRWWCRTLDILDKISSEVPDEHGNLYVMKVLSDALQDAAPDIFTHQETEPPTTIGLSADI
jgi:hypothetical protein